MTVALANSAGDGPVGVGGAALELQPAKRIKIAPPMKQQMADRCRCIAKSSVSGTLEKVTKVVGFRYNPEMA
ncbi:MAG TPA: hypothetical protein VGH32_12120, partial [Pirellulales bacterium]